LGEFFDRKRREDLPWCRIRVRVSFRVRVKARDRVSGVRVTAGVRVRV
jgi:hypothetical protein